MLTMSRIQFNRGAIELIDAFSQSAVCLLDPNDSLGQENTFSWLLEGVNNQRTHSGEYNFNPNCSDCYLVHPPILRRRRANAKNESRTENFTGFVLGKYDLEEVTQEDPAASTYENQPLDAWIEWNLSVVYSDTWRVPVLFFRALNMDGTNLSRNEVLVELGWDEGNSCDWEFVSEDEHPVTRAPSYILHPCRTAERLETLFQVDSCISSAKNDDEGSKPTECIHPPSPGEFLLSWLTLISPAIHMKIGSRQFSDLQRLLKINRQKQMLDKSNCI